VTERELLEKIKASQYVVALTGAGVSTESGIPDFRGPNGLYSKYPENVFDIDYFYADPEGFYRFWREALFPMSEGTELEFVIMVIAVSCVKLLSAHNSTQHTSRKHKV
jgi:NAD-dependent protein deacetylases, SIR2 family